MSYNGITARLQAIFHKILHPKHKVLWRADADKICPGDIICDTCDIIFWCRIQDRKDKAINKALDSEMSGFRKSYGVDEEEGKDV